MNKKYTLYSSLNGEKGGLEDGLRLFKGETELIFDFSEVGGGLYPIVKLVCDFNDGSDLYVREYDFENPSNISDELIKHIFYPKSYTDNVFYYPTFYIYFSNFNRFVYQTPIRITKESFYSRYKRVTVNSAQLVDDGENSLFVTFQTSDGDILNSKIK